MLSKDGRTSLLYHFGSLLLADLGTGQAEYSGEFHIACLNSLGMTPCYGPESKTFCMTTGNSISHAGDYGLQ